MPNRGNLGKREEGTGLDRSSAWEELKLRVEKSDNLKHSLAAEAIMRRLAGYFHEDIELWGIAGLVHDIDVERIQDDKRFSGLMGGDILEALDFDPTIIYAVRSLNPRSNCKRRRKIDRALYCVAPMSVLICACMDIQPDKRIERVDEALILSRFNDEGFAPEADRSRIAACSELDLSLGDFIRLSLEAVKEISDTLNKKV